MKEIETPRTRYGLLDGPVDKSEVFMDTEHRAFNNSTVTNVVSDSVLGI